MVAGLTRVCSGIYRHPSGQLLLRMTLQGPRGGRPIGWESARQLHDGDLYLDDTATHQTLARCAQHLERRLAGNPSTTKDHQ